MGRKFWVSASNAIIWKVVHPIHGLVFLAVTLFFALLIVWIFDNAALQGVIRSWNVRDHGDDPGAEIHDRQISEAVRPSISQRFKWIEHPTVANATAIYVKRLAENGTKACHDVKTARVHIIGFPNNISAKCQNDPIVLAAGVTHDLVMVAYDDEGRKRCAGGDYYEIDLSGHSWRSRPPMIDQGNGTYSLRLQMDPRFAGLYVFKVILLFGNFNGMRRRTNRWVRQEELLRFLIKFESPAFHGKLSTYNNIRLLPAELKRCSAEDFNLIAWSGRWTRHRHNESCNIDPRGRFPCLDPKEQCVKPWCEGPVGSLESNGWVYSAHCSFKIFEEDEAWQCLDRRWLFFWGDSNHVDTIRNLLNFVLGLWSVKSVPRRFDQIYVHPRNGSMRVRISSMFNGHANETMNYEGLHSLKNAFYREKLQSFFAGDEVPDAMIMNSGLHDGVKWKSLAEFVDAAEEAAAFWDSVVNGILMKGKQRPSFVYRNTVAPGGQARALSFNPHKMDIFNQILLEKFTQRRLPSSIVDNFDLTYPWHFDNNCSDGLHYGRTPARAKWHGQIGHQYFVDLMLIHILLNAICPHVI